MSNNICPLCGQFMKVTDENMEYRFYHCDRCGSERSKLKALPRGKTPHGYWIVN